MLDCWSFEPEDRPSFSELRKTFDKFLTTQTQDKYPYMEVLSKPYYLDTVQPKPAEPEPAVINLDIEITDIDADQQQDNKRESRISNSHSFSELGNLRLTTSESRRSLRSLTELSVHGSQAGTPLGSMHNIHAELIRQLSWERNDDADGDEKRFVDTRYVESPTSAGVSRKNTRTQRDAHVHENLAATLEEKLTSLPQQ